MNTMCNVQDTICNRDCENCGHNLAEIKRRKNLLKQNGLKKGKNGLWRLIITKKENDRGQA